MPIAHTNRKGVTFYLHSATTKHGRTRYVFARDVRDSAVEEMPEGYEIRESVNGVVSLARRGPRVITEAEEQQVSSALQRVQPDCRSDVKGREIIIHAPHKTAREYEDVICGVLSGVDPVHLMRARIREQAEEMARRAQLEPVLKFVLTDPKRRHFDAHRMTYRGSGGWSHPIGWGSLGDLLEDLLPHLGRDSFYDLV